MTLKAFTDNLQQKLNDLGADFSLNELNADTIEFIKNYVLKNVKSKGDTIIVDEDTVKTLRRFNDELKKHFDKSKPLSEYAKVTILGIKDAGDLTRTYYDANSPGLVMSELTPVQSIVIDQYVNGLTNLNEAFINPLRKLVTDNVLNFKSKTMLEKSLSDQINGANDKDGLMKRYLKTNAQIAADAYVGSVNKQFYSQFKSRITHIVVEGSLIKSSSPQCIKCVDTYKRLVPINDFKNVIIPLAEDYGLIEGTTIENVFTNKLHWGCRHIFVGVIK